jgi:hypothetical protein
MVDYRLGEVVLLYLKNCVSLLFLSGISSAGAGEDWLIDAILEEFYNTKVGNRSKTTNMVEQIIGRKPTSFVQFVRDHADSFN